MNRRQTGLTAAPKQRTALAFSFGRFKLIPARQLLLRDGVPIPLGARALDLLTALVQRSGELVSKDELMAAAWPDVFVHESNLKVNMSSLRRSLGDMQKQPTYVATVAGRGYRFVADVQTSSVGEDADQAPVALHTPPSGFPTQGHVIGREEDIAAIISHLRSKRHVTVVGAGGTGKTTVAIEVAQSLRAEYPDGICFVDLSAIDSPTLVAGTVVASLGIRGDPSDSVTAVLDYLRQRKMLMVLDNCEHVLPAASIFARRFASAAGPSTLLATSREPLGTNTEYVFWLGPLEFSSFGEPASVEETLRFPALDLFARRVSEWSGYQLVDGDCAAVAQICRSLDGLPLAIELAAAKLENRTPQELLEMLGEHLSFRQRNNGVPARHETLLATIDWSYGLLSQDEATIFRLVSVFAGAFELEDVVAIAAAAELNPMSVTIGLGGLVAKSLVTAQVSGSGLRYRLLDSTRHYALQRLLADPIEAPVRHRHAQRMLAVFEQSEGDWDWRETDDWISRYRGRLADLRAALSWSFGEGCRPELGVIAILCRS